MAQDLDDFDLADAKAEALRDILKAQFLDEPIEPLVEDFGRRFAVSRATVFRWLKKFKDGDARLSALDPQPRGPKGGTHKKISAEQHDLIVSLLKSRYMRPERPSMRQIVKEIGAECSLRGFHPPTRKTVARRLAALDEKTVAMRREGVSGAAPFQPLTGKLEADGPLSIVQIDHTLADIVIVDEVERKPIGRPWLTLAIDIKTRMVAGLYISLDSPSTLSVAQCIVQMVSDKKRWLSQRDIDLPWPVLGIPGKLHLDNAAEFKSQALRAACREWGITLDYRPVGAPHWGGHIERLIGTMMGAVHVLPGTTQSSVIERGDYESEQHACFTLAEFEEWLALQICGQYHMSIHSALEKTPLAAWDAHEADRYIRLPRDLEAFWIDFLPQKTRTLQRDGIHLFKNTYWSDVFAMMVGRMKDSLTVKYDPRDISKIWVRQPDGRMIEARYRDLRHPAVSLSEFQRADKRLRTEGKRGYNVETVFKTVLRQRQLIEDARKRTARARRQWVKNQHNAALHERFEPPAEPTDTDSGLHPIDTRDRSQTRYKVEKWE